MLEGPQGGWGRSLHSYSLMALARPSHVLGRQAQDGLVNHLCGSPGTQGQPPSLGPCDYNKP